MRNMSLLSKAYASAIDEIIRTLEIKPSGSSPIRVCTGYQDLTLTLEDASQEGFVAGPVDVREPKKSTDGRQILRFAIANVTSTAQEAVEQALESGGEVPVIYRKYLASDLSAPADNPLEMVMVGGNFDGLMLNIEASYMDPLNTAWPRDRYTADRAPGLRYI